MVLVWPVVAERRGEADHVVQCAAECALSRWHVSSGKMVAKAVFTRGCLVDVVSVCLCLVKPMLGTQMRKAVLCTRVVKAVVLPSQY